MGTTPVIRILCVEDHAVVREGLELIINNHPDMKVVGSCASGEAAIRLHRELQPDVVLMDVELPGIDGVGATQAIVGERRGTKVIVLTVHSDPGTMARAMEAGAATYLLKDTLSRSLVEAIRRVHAGSPRIPSSGARHASDRQPSVDLTAREREILTLIAEGLSNREVGTRIGISGETVHVHMRNAFSKLEVTDRTAAVMAAIRRGLIAPK